MTETDATPSVVAYDDAGNVIFMWEGCEEVEHLEQLPSNGLAGMAIKQAVLIRRRDGLVLKGTDNIEPPAAVTPQVPSRVPVSLLPPDKEIADHAPMADSQLVVVALWKALRLLEDSEMVVTDRDIVQAMSTGSISVERTDEFIILRSHQGPRGAITVLPVDAAGDING